MVASRVATPSHAEAEGREGEEEGEERGEAACEVGVWGPWSACSRPCGGGTRTRERSVGHAPGVLDCPAHTEEEECNVEACLATCDFFNLPCPED